MESIQHILLLGPPASGKGTQGKRLASLLDLPILGTGNVLRQAIEDKSEFGKQVEQYMNQGLYVPDTLIESLVEEWAAERKQGWIFDGFPRTMGQAEFIENSEHISTPNLVIGFKVSVNELEKRINSRRQCRKCNLVTSTFVHEGISCPDENCNGELYARNDDAIESFRVRYEQYQELTEPLFDYYRQKGILIEVDGELAPDEVFKLVQQNVADAIETA